MKRYASDNDTQTRIANCMWIVSRVIRKTEGCFFGKFWNQMIKSVDSYYLYIKNIYIHTYTWGFPGGASGKEATSHHRRHKRQEFDPWVEKIPWRRAWQSTPIFLFLLENSMDRGACQATVHRVTQSQTWPKWLSTHAHVYTHTHTPHTRWGSQGLPHRPAGPSPSKFLHPLQRRCIGTGCSPAKVLSWIRTLTCPAHSGQERSSPISEGAH